MRTILLGLFLITCIGIEAQNKTKTDTSTEKETIPFRVIDEVPIYPGCKGKNRKRLKECFSQSIASHFMNNFNSELPNTLGLTPGKKRLLLYFTIDREGTVIDIKAEGPHPKLEEEGERILKLLPDFVPGKVDGETVNVMYTMPLRIDVEYEDKKKN